MRHMELDGMIRVRKDLHVIVVNVRQVQLVNQYQSVLKMNVIVGNTVHNQESNTLAQGLDVAH
jgi:hypothetical protein